jgi:hypothetical protein
MLTSDPLQYTAFVRVTDRNTFVSARARSNAFNASYT